MTDLRNPAAPWSTPALAEQVATLVMAGDDGRDQAAALLRTQTPKQWARLDEASRGQAPSWALAQSRPATWPAAFAADPTGSLAVAVSLTRSGFDRIEGLRWLLAHPAEPALLAPALTLRAADHVAGIRDEARAGLAALVTVDRLEVALGVALAIAGRAHGAGALVLVERQVETTGSSALAALRASHDRDVRRWAWQRSHDGQRLSPALLESAALRDPDQWVRARAARWLVVEHAVDDWSRLLDAPAAEVRVHALTQIVDADLPDGRLRSALLDRSPRVRAVAEHRARRRGVDAASWCRSSLDDQHQPPRVLVAAIEVLSRVGGVADVPADLRLLAHPSARVRSAAVGSVSVHADPATARAALLPMLHDRAPRVTAAAARALGRLPAGESSVETAAVEAAWSSGQAWTRRAAWQVTRARGGWHRVDADLRAAVAPDDALAGLGRAGLQAWLAHGAATTWGTPSTAVAESLVHHLEVAQAAGLLGSHRVELIAFHAGLGPPTDSGADREAAEDLREAANPPRPDRRSWWRRLLGGA